MDKVILFFILTINKIVFGISSDLENTVSHFYRNEIRRRLDMSPILGKYPRPLDKFLFESEGQHTNSLVPVDQNLKLISDFITAFGVWDFHMFQNIMTPQILNVVTAMSPLSTCGTARSTRSHFEILQEITLVSSIVLLVIVPLSWFWAILLFRFVCFCGWYRLFLSS